MTLPKADTSALPWRDAAARLEIPANPWYEPLFQPRVVLGFVALGAGSISSTILGNTHASRGEQLGQGVAMALTTAIALYLIITGIRRARAKRE